MIPTLNLVDRILAMGRRYQEVGRHRDAIQILGQLSRFRYLPTEAAEETQARLAEIYFKRRKYKQARRHLTAALRHQPDNARYHYLLAVALQGEEGAELERAAEHFRRALELDPGHVKCLADYGHLLLRLGQTEEGLSRLHEAAERAPEDVEVLGKLIKGLRLAGRSEEARTLLQQAMFRHASSPRFRKLWNEFRFQQARRQSEAKRLHQDEEGTDDEPPVLLPFIRVVKESDETSPIPTIVSCEDALRPLSPSRRRDQRNVQ